MSKRSFVLVGILLIASMLYTTVAHACVDLSAMQAIFKTPCEHSGSRDEPLSKAEKDNCDLVRYGMLSTQASSSQAELFRLYSTPQQEAVIVMFSLLGVVPSFRRSQAPPDSGLGASPRLSHVVLRI